MIFADQGMVTVQEMLTGGYSAIVPLEKVEAFSDALDVADIFYEYNDGQVDVDDTTEATSTATVFTFGPDEDKRQIQEILDSIE